MEYNNIFITGPSGCGKSTIIREIVEEMDLRVKGISTPDIREGRRRVGFKLIDLKSGEEGILAHVNQSEGPRLSKYRVNMEDLERFTETSLRDISPGTGLIVIDEIGTMELFSDKFEEAVIKLLNSDIPVLGVLHRNYTERFGRYGKIYKLDKENHIEIKAAIIQDLRDIL